MWRRNVHEMQWTAAGWRSPPHQRYFACVVSHMAFSVTSSSEEKTLAAGLQPHHLHLGRSTFNTGIRHHMFIYSSLIFNMEGSYPAYTFVLEVGSHFKYGTTYFLARSEARHLCWS